MAKINLGNVKALFAGLLLVMLFTKISYSATSTAANFLQIGAGARSAGLGGAFTAVSEGALATYWNPAQLGRLESGEVHLSHFSWYQDITMQHLAASFRITDRLGLGGSLAYMNYGTIDALDLNGSVIGQLSAYDWAGGISVGYKWNDWLTTGLTGKMITQHLDTYQASTFAADASVGVETGRFKFGLMAANVGGKIMFESVRENLPTAIRLGVAAKPLNNELTAALDLEKQVYGDVIVRSGLEVALQSRYFLRAGYDAAVNSSVPEGSSSLHLGAGLKMSALGLDYAYSIGDRVLSENIHRFSLHFRFGN